jgi:putative transposase
MNARDGIPHHKGVKMNNLRFKEFYRRRLPHYQIPGATYFITFRLANSLPIQAWEKFASAQDQLENQTETEELRWLERLDTDLDGIPDGPSYLKDDRVARIVSDAIHFRNNRQYDLYAFCIMPNHVHMVSTPLMKTPDTFYGLPEIMHSLKGYSARQANLVLGRTGAFWQEESYDHVVRNQAELERIVQYVLYNPVQAGLTETWQDWQWSYSKWNL